MILAKSRKQVSSNIANNKSNKTIVFFIVVILYLYCIYIVSPKQFLLKISIMQHPIEFLRTEPHYHPFPPRDVGRVSPMFGKQWSEDIDFMLIDRVFLFLVWSKPEHGDCPGGDELDELFQTVSKSWWKATSRWVPSTSASSQSDLSPLVTQIDEHEQPEKTNLSPQPWEHSSQTLSRSDITHANIQRHTSLPLAGRDRKSAAP